jgi:general stress protein 26
MTLKPEIHAGAELIRNSRFLILSTIDENRLPESRTLFNLRFFRSSQFTELDKKPSSPFLTWLATNTSSRKVSQLRRDGGCCLYYFNGDGLYEGICLKGNMHEENDPRIRDAIWTDEWNHYYPGGKDGGDFSVLRFEPSSARYYCGLKTFEFKPGEDI